MVQEVEASRSLIVALAREAFRFDSLARPRNSEPSFRMHFLAQAEEACHRTNTVCQAAGK